MTGICLDEEVKKGEEKRERRERERERERERKREREKGGKERTHRWRKRGINRRGRDGRRDESEVKWILTNLAVCADSMSEYCINAWKEPETQRNNEIIKATSIRNVRRMSSAIRAQDLEKSSRRRRHVERENRSAVITREATSLSPSPCFLFFFATASEKTIRAFRTREIKTAINSARCYAKRRSARAYALADTIRKRATEEWRNS